MHICPSLAVPGFAPPAIILAAGRPVLFRWAMPEIVGFTVQIAIVAGFVALATCFHHGQMSARR